MASTKIEWTDRSWNPVTGCDRLSPGCARCYALTLAARLKAMGQARYQRDGNPATSGPGFGVTLHPDVLDAPRRWRKPSRVFVNSMSDLFHPDVPLEFIQSVFATMAACPQHTFQVLTKRSQRLAQVAPLLPWPPNVWMGVSVETDRYTFRASDLLSTPAAVKFVSAEPLLGAVPSLPVAGLDWVIVGGESGPGARLMEEAWAADLVTRATAANTPVFFKQLGSVLAREVGASGKGAALEDIPVSLRVREYPV